MAFVGETNLLGQHAGNHAAHGVSDRHGRDFAAGQHEIPDRDFLVHALVNKALVDALVVTAYDDKMLVR